MVVLDHLLLDAELHERAAAVGLDEEAALVAEHLGFDDDGAVQPGLDPLHRGRNPNDPETSGGCGNIALR
jgi:hypothetical protein